MSKITAVMAHRKAWRLVAIARHIGFHALEADRAVVRDYITEARHILDAMECFASDKEATQ